MSTNPKAFLAVVNLTKWSQELPRNRPTFQNIPKDVMSVLVFGNKDKSSLSDHQRNCFQAPTER
jgi:hypothetical protein